MRDETDKPPLSQDPDINPQAGAVSDETPPSVDATPASSVEDETPAAKEETKTNEE